MSEFDMENGHEALLIQQIVERFLAWPLPEGFNPDGGISYSPTFNTGTPYEGKNHPTGTNLLDYTQAEAMVRHILAGVDLLEKVDEWDGPLTDDEQAKINAAWERHKAAKPAVLAHIERPAGDEYVALRKLVKDAYNEGFTEGMREHTSSRGGKPWPDSAAKKALERICFDCGDVKDCYMNCGPVKP